MVEASFSHLHYLPCMFFLTFLADMSFVIDCQVKYNIYILLHVATGS